MLGVTKRQDRNRFQSQKAGHRTGCHQGCDLHADSEAKVSACGSMLLSATGSQTSTLKGITQKPSADNATGGRQVLQTDSVTSIAGTATRQRAACATYQSHHCERRSNSRSCGCTYVNGPSSVRGLQMRLQPLLLRENFMQNSFLLGIHADFRCSG